MAHLAHFNRRRMMANATGSKTEVPNDSYGRLCYYLRCVESVGAADLPAFMTDYKNWQSKTADQKRRIVNAARQCHPDKVIRFHEVEDVPGGSNNEFLKLSSLQESVTAIGTGSVMALQRRLGGQEQHGTVMLHNAQWLRDNYHRPMQAVGGASGNSNGAEALVGMLALLALAASNDSDSD